MIRLHTTQVCTQISNHDPKGCKAELTLTQIRIRDLAPWQIRHSTTWRRRRRIYLSQNNQTSD